MKKDKWAKITLRFWLRKDKLSNDGKAPVYLICQISGQRKYYAIPDIKIFAANWNAKEQEAVYLDKNAAKKLLPGIDYDNLPTSKDVIDINRKLESYRKDVEDIEKRFELDNEAYGVFKVIDALDKIRQPLARKEYPSENVIEFIKQFAKDSTATHAVGTLKAYTGLAAHLEEFEKKKGIKITFENLDTSILRSFNGFLTDTRRKKTKTGKDINLAMNNITAAKQISTLKTILTFARTIYKYKVNQDYKDFKVSRKDSDFEVITLTQDEFTAIYSLDLTSNKRLDSVRDVFCFSCTTGLRFGDLEQLSREHIRKDNTIRMTAAKTGQKLVIPLNTISHSILKKYSHLHKPLPIISNQKTNDYIKEIGQLAGIDTPIEKVRPYGNKMVSKIYKKYELLSIHIGRKSFITLSLEKGIAIQEVMQFSGHTTFKAFRRYVDVNDSRKKTVMAEAWGEVKPGHLKAV